MYTYPFFSIFWYSVVMVLFCFSPSLPFLDSLSMAPKRKPTPSQNPLRSRASSSNPTPFHIPFRDEKARKDFSKNFSNCDIHSKCHVVLSDFSNIALPTFIHNQGWKSLCEIPVRCPTMIILKFYYNMHSFDTSIPQFVTQIQGTRIIVTSKIVSKILHVPQVSHPNYPACP